MRAIQRAEEYAASTVDESAGFYEAILDDLAQFLTGDHEAKESAAVRIQAWSTLYCRSAHFSWRRLDPESLQDIVGDGFTSFLESARDPKFQQRLALRELKACLERYRKRVYRSQVSHLEVNYAKEAIRDIGESEDWWGRAGISREDLQAAARRIYEVLPAAAQQLNSRYYNIIVDEFGLEELALERRPDGRSVANTSEARGKARHRALVQLSKQLERVLEARQVASPTDEILALALKIVRADVSTALAYGLECLCRNVSVDENR